MNYADNCIPLEFGITFNFFFFFSSRASDYGLMKIDETGRIIQFAEKPKGPDLKAMVHALLINSFLTIPLFSFFFVHCYGPDNQSYK